jgi:hypothetical protein
MSSVLSAIVTMNLAEWPENDEPPGSKIIGSLNRELSTVMGVERVWFGNVEPPPGKALQAIVAVGALNYVSLWEMCEAMRHVSWNEPVNVRLFAQHDQGEYFAPVDWPIYR